MTARKSRDNRRSLLERTDGNTFVGRFTSIYIAMQLSDPQYIQAMINTRDLRMEISAAKSQRHLRQAGYDQVHGLEEERSLHKLALEYNLWRLYPYGLLVEVNDTILIFDRNYCPIVRISFEDPPDIVPPLEPINSFKEERYFYEDANSVFNDPDTFGRIFQLAAIFRIKDEISYRMELANDTFIHQKVWGPKWERR